MGHLNFPNCYYFVTLEKEDIDLVAIRNYEGIQGWIKKEKELIAKLIKRQITVYFKPICSPYIVKKEREFEFRQKGSMLVSLKTEQDACYVMELLTKEGLKFDIVDSF